VCGELEALCEDVLGGLSAVGAGVLRELAEGEGAQLDGLGLRV
jgi:hypothetical protein